MPPFPSILYEDHHVLIVEKPPNVPTLGDHTGDADLLTLLRARAPSGHLAPVHRLDRPVGGVMVFAKTARAAAHLSQAVKRRKFDKQYLAVVRGRPAPVSGRLSHFLLKNEKTNTVSVIEPSVPGAVKALLDYATQETQNGFSLVKIKLLTGRPHQIRVQMAAAGHPLVGDEKYNPEKKTGGIALWSHALAFSHPALGQKMRFFSNPPAKFPWTLFPSLAARQNQKPRTPPKTRPR